MSFTLSRFDLDAFVRATLAEDLGPTGRDVTSESVIPADARFSGVMDSRDPIIVAGLPIAAAFFRHLDPAIEIDTLADEGASIAAGSDLMRLSGKARALAVPLIAGGVVGAQFGVAERRQHQGRRRPGRTVPERRGN